MIKSTHPIDNVLSRLSNVTEKGENQYLATCPAHDDKDPSLSVKEVAGGTVLLKCHAGCTALEIVSAINLSMQDLFIKKDGPASAPKKKKSGKIVQVYDYNDETGKLLFQVCRRAKPKDFSQRRPDGNGGFVWKGIFTDGCRRVLYRLPELLKTDLAETIFKVEGEKDVDSLAAIGLKGTTSSGGADKFHLTDSTPLNDRPVVMLPDDDPAGQKDTDRTAAALIGTVASLKVLRLPNPDKVKGFDVTDWILKHNGKADDAIRNELLKLADDAPLYEPAPITARPTPAPQTKPTIEITGEEIQNTDLGNARRFIADHGDKVRYCRPKKLWYLWNGRYWEPDERGKIIFLAKKTVAGMYKQAADLDDADRKKLAGFAIKSESDRAIRAMLHLAESEQKIVVLPVDLDADDYLLNCENGTLNLETMELQEHDKDNLITKTTGVSYDLAAESELFEGFRKTVFCNSTELELFTKKAFGSTLESGNPDEHFFFLFGPSGSGKSTLLDAVRCGMGDYANTADFAVFLKHDRQGNTPRTGLVPLVGSRFVSSSEVDEGKALAEGLLNAMSGGDHLRIRDLYEKSFEVKPSWTLFLSANTKPHLTEDEENGIWRRILMVPFVHKIDVDEQDPEVKKELSDPEKSGAAILAWLVRGYVAWKETGKLKAPQFVQDAVRGYRLEMDIVQGFLKDIKQDPKAYVESGVLKRAFEEATGRRWTSKIIKRLKELGFTPTREYIDKESRRVWKGLSV